MKENLYQSKYQQIFFEQEEGIMHNLWLSDSFTMPPKGYKDELLKLVQLIETKQATKQLINTLDFQFTIDIELQDWTDEYITKKNKEAGVRKVAFIIAEEIFSQMSIEQTMDGDEGKIMDVRYFTSEQEAREWLTKD
jgi:hypothetical protein